MACVVKPNQDHKWYRGLILSCCLPDIDVLFVDFGYTQTCKIQQVKAIVERFVTLPKQAVECKLSGIGGSGQWTDEEKCSFETRTLGKSLKAHIGRRDPQGVLRVRLVEESNGSLTIINEMFGAPSSIGVPPPDLPYTPLTIPESQVNVNIAWFYNPMRFFISPVDLSGFQVIT